MMKSKWNDRNPLPVLLSRWTTPCSVEEEHGDTTDDAEEHSNEGDHLRRCKQYKAVLLESVHSCLALSFSSSSSLSLCILLYVLLVECMCISDGKKKIKKLKHESILSYLIWSTSSYLIIPYLINLWSDWNDTSHANYFQLARRPRPNAHTTLNRIRQLQSRPWPASPPSQSVSHSSGPPSESESLLLTALLCGLVEVLSPFPPFPLLLLAAVHRQPLHINRYARYPSCCCCFAATARCLSSFSTAISRVFYNIDIIDKNTSPKNRELFDFIWRAGRQHINLSQIYWHIPRYRKSPWVVWSAIRERVVARFSVRYNPISIPFWRVACFCSCDGWFGLGRIRMIRGGIWGNKGSGNATKKCDMQYWNMGRNARQYQKEAMNDIQRF